MPSQSSQTGLLSQTAQEGKPEAPPKPKLKLSLPDQKFEKPKAGMVQLVAVGLFVCTLIGDQLLWQTSSPIALDPEELRSVGIPCDSSNAHASLVLHNKKGASARWRCGGTFLHIWPFYSYGTSKELAAILVDEPPAPSKSRK